MTCLARGRTEPHTRSPQLQRLHTHTQPTMPSQGVLESMANVVAGSFALAACVISVFSIAAHLRSTRHAQLCNYTIRVLLMVPIYAGEAWAGLVWHSNSTIWAVARSCYEAFVIFSFMQVRVLRCFYYYYAATLPLSLPPLLPPRATTHAKRYSRLTATY